MAISVEVVKVMVVTTDVLLVSETLRDADTPEMRPEITTPSVGNVE
jgi:hypothetical protein